MQAHPQPVIFQPIACEVDGGWGIDRFQKQAQYLVHTCLSNEPFDVERPVRIPGSRALQLKKKHMKEGLPLSTSIVEALVKWSDRYGVDSEKYLSTN